MRREFYQLRANIATGNSPPHKLRYVKLKSTVFCIEETSALRYYLAFVSHYNYAVISAVAANATTCEGRAWQPSVNA